MAKAIFYLTVGAGRLELPRISPYAPEAYAYTNSATRPYNIYYTISAEKPRTTFIVAVFPLAYPFLSLCITSFILFRSPVSASIEGANLCLFSRRLSVAFEVNNNFLQFHILANAEQSTRSAEAPLEEWCSTLINLK